MSEELKPIAAENEQFEEQSANLSESPATEEVQSENYNEEEAIDFSNKGLKDLVDMLQDLLDKADVQQLYKYAESIKAAFYRTLKKEKIAAGLQENETVTAKLAEAAAESEDAPKAEEEIVSVNPFAEVERGFKELFGKYKVIRTQYVQDLNQKKEENLAVKTEVIEELKALVENPGDINKAYPTFRELQAKWRSAGAVPQANSKDIYSSYNHYVESFYDFVKINRELRELDLKKNLEAKENLCQRAEALADSKSPVNSFRELQKLHEEWKEYGPVDREFRESIWERFRAATAVVNKKHQEFFESQKGAQQQNLAAKVALCEKIEAILEEINANANSKLNDIFAKVESIKQEWKTIGFASKKDNAKIYDRFRETCNKINAIKKEYYSEYKSQIRDNKAKKVSLCEQAEALAESTDWKKTSDILIGLQKQWKESGVIPHKQSELLWKRFRSACDTFFEKKNQYFSEKDRQFDENLIAKNALLEEITDYESQSEALDKAAAHDFQEKWDAIGFVPMKDKVKVMNAYAKAMNDKFGITIDLDQALRSRRRKFEPRGKFGQKVLSEKDRLIQKFIKMEQDIATWENNMGFFAASKNAEQLLSELTGKIEVAKQELADLEDKIKSFDKEENEQE